MEHNEEHHHKPDEHHHEPLKHHVHHIHHEHHKHSEHKEHHKIKKTLSRSFYNKVYVVLGIALIIFALYNTFQISSFSALFEQKLIESKEAARPAAIELVVITTNTCKDCYDIDAVVDVVESTGVNITKKKEIDFSSKEAESLIDKYGIKKAPTVIVTGELDRARSLKLKFNDMGEEKQDAYIFTKLEPPFIETSTGKIRGRVLLTHLKKNDCEDCSDLTLLISQLSESGIKFEKKKNIDIDTEEGKTLISKYKIKQVPTIIMNKEAEVYPNIIQSWNQLGSIENDGSFIMRELTPPYYSIEEEMVKGLISITFLADKSCSDCYDAAEFHKPVLQRMSVLLEEEKSLDISDAEGKALVEKYSIGKVPTIILEGDVEEYSVLVNAWKDVGTVETDGAYVFRKVEVAGQAYKDLSTNKVVEPSAS